MHLRQFAIAAAIILTPVVTQQAIVHTATDTNVNLQAEPIMLDPPAPPTAIPLPPVWKHPLLGILEAGKADWEVRGHNTAALYKWAISHDIPIREWPITFYHPNESGGEGGGWSTADGGGFRPECVASAMRWYPYWKGHELWFSGIGRVVVGDNGPGWGSKHQFDLPGASGRWVDEYERHGPNQSPKKCIVVWCPHPESCDCDYAVCWRKANGIR